MFTVDIMGKYNDTVKLGVHLALLSESFENANERNNCYIIVSVPGQDLSVRTGPFNLVPHDAPKTVEIASEVRSCVCMCMCVNAVYMCDLCMHIQTKQL